MKPRFCLSLLASLLLAREAGAQALSTPNVGTGLSGPATQDPAAVYWNPGMLAYTDRPTFLLGGSLVAGSVVFRREYRATYQRSDSLAFNLPIPADAVDASKTGYAEPSRATPIAAAPSLFAAIPLLRDRIVAGFGVYAPYAAILNFDPNGAQRFSLQSATIASIYMTPSLAVRIHEAFTLGAGFSYVLGYAELSRVQDFAALGDVGAALARQPINQQNGFGAMASPGLRELDVLARPIRLRNMWAHGFTFNVGVASRPTRGLTIGLAYMHSAQMNFQGQFQLDMNDPFFTRDLASQGLQFRPLIQGDASLSFPLPRAVFLGVNLDVSPRLGFGLTAQYTTWSQVQNFDVRVRSPDLAQPVVGLPDTSQILLARGWRDTFAAELTVRYTPLDRLTTWVTAGYHSPASPDNTIDVASPDGHRLIAAAGLRFALTPRTALLGDVEMQTILPRHIVSSDYDLGNGDYYLTVVNLGLHLLHRL